MTPIPHGDALLDPNCLNVHKLADPVLCTFSSVPRKLDTTERQARVGSHHLVQEDHAGIEFVDEPFGFRRIIGPSARTEPEAAVVRDLDGLIRILDAKN